MLARDGKVENAMATPLVPFCSGTFKYVYCSTRIPGEEKDDLVTFHKEKPVHAVVYW